MSEWYSDPEALRREADLYDFKSRATLAKNIASAWAGKAEALRSRADIIAKASALAR